MKVSKLESYPSMYLMEVSSSLLHSNLTICNVYVDEERKTLHFYDDLKHQSTTIVSEIDRNDNLLIEFSSLIGFNCDEYRVFFYYAPIANKPFILEYNYKNKSQTEAPKEAVYTLFESMAMEDKAIIKS